MIPERVAEDALLVRLFEHCSPEQKLRGSTPREVLATLTPADPGLEAIGRAFDDAIDLAYLT